MVAQSKSAYRTRYHPTFSERNRYNMTLPIDLIPNTNPPRFQWKQRVTTPVGDKVIAHEGTLPPMLEEAVSSLIAQVKQLTTERDELANKLANSMTESPPRQPTTSSRKGK